MNKQLGKKILLVLAAVMVMILLSSFKMQNEGDRSFKKIVLNKNKSVESSKDEILNIVYANADDKELLLNIGIKLKH